MGKFDGILICTDLDGTLLRNDKSVSDENREAIEYFKSEGGFFTFVTGRMPFYVADAYNKAVPNAPIGCVNGGGAYDMERGEYVYTTELPREAFKLIDAVVAEIPDIGVQISSFNNAYFSIDSTAMMHFRRVTRVPNLVRHWYDVEEPIAKVIFGDEDEGKLMRAAEIMNAHPLADSYSFIRSERTLYEILPKGVNKGSCIPVIASAVGTTPRLTVGVGDYDNDIGLLRTAGVGVAVANARESVKAVADYVTVSNEEHAIAKIIRDIEDGIITFNP